MGDICVVILAAGKGTRMLSLMPKVLHKVGGLPLVHHVANTALSLNPQRTILVLSKALPPVVSYAERALPQVTSVFQEEQKGTAHALLCARSDLEHFKGTVLVLFGDTPLIRPETLKKLVIA